MQNPIDEQGWGFMHTRSDSAVHGPTNTCEYAGTGSVAVEALDVELELGRIAAQVAFRERRLAVEEHLMHVPEPTLDCSRLEIGRAHV